MAKRLRASTVALLVLIALLAAAVRLAPLPRFSPEVRERAGFRTAALAATLSPASSLRDLLAPLLTGGGVDGGSGTHLLALVLAVARVALPLGAFDAGGLLSASCVAPLLAALTAIAIFYLGCEACADDEDEKEGEGAGASAEHAGLVSAALAAVVPALASRTLAGSLDAEACLVVPLLSLSLLLWLRALRSGSALRACSAALAHCALVALWGRESAFVAAVVPLHALLLLVLPCAPAVTTATGAVTAEPSSLPRRLHRAFSTWVLASLVLGLAFSVVRPPRYDNLVAAVWAALGTAMSGNELACLVFVPLQGPWVWRLLRDRGFGRLAAIVALAGALVAVASAVLAAAAAAGPVSLARLAELVDPSIARHRGGSNFGASFVTYLAASENGPATWARLYLDLHALLLLVPAGLVNFVLAPSPGRLLLVALCAPALVFAARVARLTFVLAPAACLLAGPVLADVTARHAYAALEFLGGSCYRSVARGDAAEPVSARQRRRAAGELGAFSMLVVSLLLAVYLWHSAWAVTSYRAYGGPGSALVLRAPGGNVALADDLREACGWVRASTPRGSRLLAWVHRADQIGFLCERPIVAGIGSNASAVAAVARALLSPEASAAAQMRELGAHYVVVVFGGFVAEKKDDLEDCLIMARAAMGLRGAPSERDLRTRSGELRIDGGAVSPVLERSLLFRLSFGRFGGVASEAEQPTGFDRARRTVAAKVLPDGRLFEESYTSRNWFVRVYRLKKGGEPASLPFLADETEGGIGGGGGTDDLLAALGEVAYEDEGFAAEL